jgi:hypothetical protein
MRTRLEAFLALLTQQRGGGSLVQGLHISEHACSSTFKVTLVKLASVHLANLLLIPMHVARCVFDYHQVIRVGSYAQKFAVATLMLPSLQAHGACFQAQWTAHVDAQLAAAATLPLPKHMIAHKPLGSDFWVYLDTKAAVQHSMHPAAAALMGPLAEQHAHGVAQLNNECANLHGRCQEECQQAEAQQAQVLRQIAYRFAMATNELTHHGRDVGINIGDWCHSGPR